MGVTFNEDVEVDVMPSPDSMDMRKPKVSIADSIDMTQHRKKLFRIETGTRTNFTLDLEKKELMPYTPREENDSVLFLDEIPDDIRDPLSVRSGLGLQHCMHSIRNPGNRSLTTLHWRKG